MNVLDVSRGAGSRRRRLKLIGAISAGVVLTSTLAACGGGDSGGDANEVVIGVPLSLTGASAAYYLPQANAIKMEAAAINKAGGIKELGGAKIKLLVRDTKSDPAVAAKLVRQMSAEGVTAFIGPNASAELIANKPLIQSLKIPTFVGSGDVTVTKDQGAGYIFRVNPISADAAVDTVEFVGSLIESGQIKDVKQVGILAMNTPPGPSVIPAFADGFKELGIDSTPYEYDVSQTKDFAPIVAKMRDKGTDLVVGFQYPNDATLFANAVGNQSWRPQGGFFFSGSPQFMSSFRKSTGAATAGWVTSAFTPNLQGDKFPQETRDLAVAFEKKYGFTLEGSTGDTGASCLAVLVDAVAAAKSKEPEDVAKAARTLSFDDPNDSAYPFYMKAGGLKFDKDQNNKGFITPMAQVTDSGGIETVFPTDMADGPYKPQG